MLDSGLNPKPAYSAYRTAVQQLGPASFVSILGTQETGSEEIEAYRFMSADRTAWILVAWTNDAQNHAMIINTRRQVKVVSKYGVETVVRDGDDGQVDGRVRLTIGPSPIYIRY